MKKVTVIVLAILVMAVGALAQGVGQGPWTNSGKVGSGDHISHGCLLCHAPHTAGGNTVSYASPTTPTADNFGSDWGANPKPAKIYAANLGLQTGTAGSIYLWAVAMTPQTYTTWDGTQFSAAGVTKQNAVVHTLLCMTCHDNATGTHEMGAYNDHPTNNGLENPIENGGNGEAMGNSRYNYANGATWGGIAGQWGANSSIQRSHPVHAVYTGGGSMWKIDSNGNFLDANASKFAYGHPAKLWMENGKAYVECTTCHDPHRLQNTAFWNGTNYTISKTPNTIFYVRGPYTDPEGASANGNTNANFCRSCHFSKSQEYVTMGGVE